MSLIAACHRAIRQAFRPDPCTPASANLVAILTSARGTDACLLFTIAQGDVMHLDLVGKGVQPSLRHVVHTYKPLVSFPGVSLAHLLVSMFMLCSSLGELTMFS
jgi:hypothetical protein